MSEFVMVKFGGHTVYVKALLAGQTVFKEVM